MFKILFVQALFCPARCFEIKTPQPTRVTLASWGIYFEYYIIFCSRNTFDNPYP